ncbi:MAG: tetratricopeptide repeat protein [Bryobacteraceae bacterium]
MSISVFPHVLVGVVICALPIFGQLSAPESTLLSIQDAVQAGNYGEADHLITNALAAFPKDGALVNLRGVVHADRNELAEARKDFELAVKLAPSLTAAWQNLARSCQLTMARDAAASQCAAGAWQRVLKMQPNDPEARFSLAAVYHQQAKYADSLREIDKLPKDELARAPTLALKLADLAGLSRLPEAAQTAQQLPLSSDFTPADAEWLLPELSKPNGASLLVTLVEGLDARGAASPEALRQLVVAYEQLNRLSDARKTLERLYLADPKNTQHLFELARVAYLSHDLEGSVGYLGHARDLAPNDPQVHFLFGLVVEQLDLPLEARKSLAKAVELDPRNPDYNYALGTIILSARDASPAIACFRIYADARPGDPKGHFALGVAYFMAGDYENCKREMLGVSNDAKTAGGAAYFLARIARIEDNLDQAVVLLNRCIGLLPKFAEAYVELARVRLRQDRMDEAQAALSRALSLDPDSFQANNTLLIVYQRTHDPRAGEQKAHLQKLDEERSERQELMLRSIEVKPY